MKTAVHLFSALSICLCAFAADPVELRLWPGKAPGSENWTVPESITNRGGNRVKRDRVDPVGTVRPTARRLSWRPAELSKRFRSIAKASA